MLPRNQAYTRAGGWEFIARKNNTAAAGGVQQPDYETVSSSCWASYVKDSSVKSFNGGGGDVFLLGCEK